MSLVGTRPILQDELLKYELHHRARIAIKPGITGMWQVSGRSDITDFEEVVRLDTEYISNLDPYANAVYLFCGRDSRKLKALHFDKDGFVLLQKRLDGNGRFQWPRNASEARLLTRQEFRWLMEGLSIDQPKAIKGTGRKKDF